MTNTSAHAVQVERVDERVVVVPALDQAESLEGALLVLTDAHRVADVQLTTGGESEHVPRRDVVLFHDGELTVGSDAEQPGEVGQRRGTDDAAVGRDVQAATDVRRGQEVVLVSLVPSEGTDGLPLLRVDEEHEAVAPDRRVAVVGEVVLHVVQVPRVDDGGAAFQVVVVAGRVDRVLPLRRHHGVTVVEGVDVDGLAVDVGHLGGAVEHLAHDAGEHQAVVRFESGVVQRLELRLGGLCEEHPGVADGEVPPLEVVAHPEGRPEADTLRLTELRGFLEILLDGVSDAFDQRGHVER